jgi:hypothetical protein
MRAFAFVGLLCAGCGVLDFDVTQNIPAQMIPGNPAASMLPASVLPGTLSFTFDVAQQQKQHGVTIDSVHMKAFSLDIDPSSATQNFDWLGSLQIEIASAKAGSTLPRVVIAMQATVPKGVTHVDFTVDGSVNLLPYINEGTAITTSGSGRPTANGVTITGKLVVKVSPV